MNDYGINCALHGTFMMEGLRDRCIAWNHTTQYGDGYSALLTKFEYGGALELMLALCEYSPYFEAKLRDVNDDADWPGVYEYEVVNLFGQWFADYVYEHGHVPTTVDATNQIDKLHDEFFSLGGLT